MDVIPREETQVLAELYDRFAHALDPFSKERDVAEMAFYRQLEHLHCKHAPSVSMKDFKREAVRQCKLFLRKSSR